MSVYKPYEPEADAAAEMAVALGRRARSSTPSPRPGRQPDAPRTSRRAAHPGRPLTKDNIKDTVVKDGLYTVAEICTAKYKAACDELGLK